MKIRYCPVCGQRSEEKLCTYCPNQIPTHESIYDSSYYSNKAESLGRYAFLGYQILFEEEVVNNPLYNPEAHERSEEIYNQRFKESTFDPLKYNSEYQNLPKCPTCSSTNIKKLSFANRYLHYRAIGFLSKTARSQFVCNNCGYKW